MKIFHVIKNCINYLLFPARCISCGSLNSNLCNKCEKELQKEFNPVVVGTRNNLNCVSCFVYNGIIKQIIHNFKFRNQKNSSIILSKFLCVAIKSKLNGRKFDTVTFVPNYDCYSYRREYNQSEILAKELSDRIGIPLEKCLVKVRKNKRQHNLSFAERQVNVKGVYSAISSPSNQNILLCDDIITTGATLSECVKELEKSGAKVTCLTVAHTLLK